MSIASIADYISKIIFFIVSLVFLLFSLRTNQFNRDMEELKIKLEFDKDSIEKNILFSLCIGGFFWDSRVILAPLHVRLMMAPGREKDIRPRMTRRCHARVLAWLPIPESPVPGLPHPSRPGHSTSPHRCHRALFCRQFPPRSAALPPVPCCWLSP